MTAGWTREGTISAGAVACSLASSHWNAWGEADSYGCVIGGEVLGREDALEGGGGGWGVARELI